MNHWGYLRRKGQPMKKPSKMVVNLFAFCVTILFSTSLLLAAPTMEPAEVVIKDRAQLDGLVKLDVSIDRVDGEVVTVYVTPEEFDHIRARDLDIRWIPNRAKIYADDLWRATKGTANPMAAYHTYEELVADLDSIASAHPSICRLDSIGASVQGRGLWFMKMSDDVNVEEDEPEFKYISTMHGDEVVGMEMCFYLIEYLVNNYGTDSLATFLVDETEIWIMPLMNPDGNALHQRGNANGVDLNRDFPDFVTDPVNTTAGREQETGVIMNWQFEHHPIQSANFHGGALVMNYPWDSTWDYNPDDTLFRDISLTYSSTNLPMWNSPTWHHGVVRGVEWYLIHGGMQDWNYYWMGCNDVTAEISNVKWPDASTLPTYWDDNRESMLNYMARVHDGVRGLVTDASTALPLDATVTVSGIDHEVYTDPDVGDYHRMLLPGTYSLTFSAEGYTPQTVNNVVVVPESATVVNVQLYAIALGNISGTVTAAGKGDPLEATVEVLGSGFDPVSSDSVTGAYSINVYEGTYTMRVSKDGYGTVLRDSVTVSGSIVEDFELSPLAVYLYTSEDSLAIPDPGYISSVIAVTDSFTVDDLNVYIDITHTYIGDLDVELENPQGDLIYLHHQTGGSDDDIVTWYDTQTEPYGDLKELLGKSSKGDWTLWVTDHSGWDEGTLNQWKLQLYGQGDFSAPTAIADLQATLAADKLSLSWSPASDDFGVSHYVIYRNTDPAFQPQGSDSIGWTDQTSFLDPDSPLENTSVNGYYIVKAVDTSGNKASNSNRVGEFDRELEGGTSKNKHKKVWIFDRG
jgi:subtilisin-like proprotein convertase family protein